MPLFFLFILLAFLAGDIAWFVAVRRNFVGGGKVRVIRIVSYAFITTIAALLLAMLLGRIVGIRADGLMPRPVLICVYLWHFIGLAAGLVVLIAAAPARIARGARSKHESQTILGPDRDAETPQPSSEASEPAITRRELLTRIAVLTPAAVTVAGTFASEFELSRFRIREIDVPLRTLPSALDGLTIAHVSDVHLGRFTTNETFRRIVEATNALDCDLVLQTGDLINYDQRDLPAAAEMTHALRGRYGQFMCEGNHDLIEGREAFEASARRLRLPILIDELRGVTVNGVEINLLGVPWIRSMRGVSLDQAYTSAVRELAARRSSAAFPILLAHHPHAFDAAVASDLPLTLSGHTHGGQLHLSKRIGFGPLMYRYWSGLYERDGHACVVSNGAGNWFPIRANAPAEILRLTLRRLR